MRRAISAAATAAALTALLAASALPAAAQTSTAAKPQATTGASSAITDTSAKVSGTVNPGGQATTYEFQYGTTTDYGQQTAPQTLSAGTSPQSVSATISGLTPGTTFHYRLLATNASGTAAGQDQTFTTSGTAPPPANTPKATVVTGPASNVQTHSVVLTGAVTSTGDSAKWYFEYGTTAFYGSQTTQRTMLRTPPNGRAINVTLTGLQADQQYHYRLVAQNGAGLVTGPDRTFSTVPTTRALPARLTLVTRALGTGSGPLRVSMTGSLTPPAGVSRSRACRGLVSLQVKRGTATISLRRVQVRPDCTYSGSVRFASRARFRGRSRLRVFAHFLGNDVLAFRTTGPSTVAV